ncbi:MAG: hypothetical protein J1E29_01670 [Duncaniella sp.]|nr:hypothetical protein [Duncaniella sp.]
MRILLPIIALWLLVQGCNAVGCTDNQNSVPLAGFYSMSTLAPMNVDSIAISGIDAPNDSLLLAPSEIAHQVYLPLRANQPQTEFVISYRQHALDYPEFRDTIRIAYKSIPYFASEDCGAMYHYRITSLIHTTHLIDSIGLSDSTITNVERETISIYFRTSNPDEDDPA